MLGTTESRLGCVQAASQRFVSTLSHAVASEGPHAFVRALWTCRCARTQLAAKNSPNVIERYFIFVSQELAKKLKTDGDGLDLMGFVEFQRNYRCPRACAHMCVGGRGPRWAIDVQQPHGV